MNDKETPSGKHTLGGDGEPAQVTKVTRFRATMGTDHEGNPMLVFDADEISYVIKGEDLFNFYAMLKRGMEGMGKRPTYLS